MSLQPIFETLTDPTGLDVIDPVENRHVSLLTDRPVSPTSTTTDPFEFPVATACRISVTKLRLRYMTPVDVRAPNGDPRASVDSPTTHRLPDDDYLLELHSPIKLYLRVSGAGEITVATDSVRFEFDRETDVEVGARSYHSAPAETVTVPDDPEGMMAAVSTFGSALKTTSPERAWPTLRGHPPEIERGEELSIPDGLDAPDTGVRIEAPAEHWAVYAVAPLAYYLGADVVPGEGAVRLAADSGVDRVLGDDPESVADAVAATLKRVFFLDCVVRTEGLYPDDLHERELLEDRVDLDFAGLYDAPLAERLDRYLAVPDEAVEPIRSPWHRVTHVEPTPEAVEVLPYVVNDLSLVRPEVADGEPEPMTEAQRELGEEVGEFLRGPSASEAATAGDFVRSAGPLRRTPESDRDGTRGTPDLDEYVSLPEVDALEQAWVGEGTPLRGTKLVREAFVNETPEPSDGTIDVTVVCNDEAMREEWDSVGEIYASREDVRVDVTSESGVSTGQLRDLLAGECDLFHFIGHIDGLGFQCSDGVLDAATLDTTGATTVLLNGCRSHDQGVDLVKAGANAAIVSLSDLFNEGAVEVGRTVARLLHHGFDVGATMKIVREYTSIGNRYAVIGDPGTIIVENEGIFPVLFKVIEENEDTVTLEPHSYPVRGNGVGSMYKPIVTVVDKFHVIGGPPIRRTLTYDEFRESIDGPSEPLLVDNSLVWSDLWFKRK